MRERAILDAHNRIKVEMNEQDFLLAYFYMTDTANVPLFGLLIAPDGKTGTIQYAPDGGIERLQIEKEVTTFTRNRPFPKHRWCPEQVSCIPSVFEAKQKDVFVIGRLKDKVGRLAAEMDENEMVSLHLYKDWRATIPQLTFQYTFHAQTGQLGIHHIQYLSDGSYWGHVDGKEGVTKRILPDHEWQKETPALRLVKVAKPLPKQAFLTLGHIRED